MDSENLPDETPAEPDRPVNSRRTPVPRTAEEPTARIPGSDPRVADPRNAETRTIDARRLEGRPTGTRTSESRASTSRIGEPRNSDSRISDSRISDPRTDEQLRPVAETTVPTNIYRARRPAVAAFLIVPALVIGFLLVRGLGVAGFGQPFVLSGVIASALGLASLPLLVSGLYGLITGAAHGAEQWGFRVWARPPLAYLIVGIAFVLAAGIAVR